MSRTPLFLIATCLVCTACPGTEGDETSVLTDTETGDGDGDGDPGDGDGDPGDGDGDPGDICGDGVVTGDEACDLGMANSDTGECTSTCTIAICGDGLVYADAEACDGAGESEDCNEDCTVAACGDGIVNASAGESCEGDVDNNGTCEMCELICDPNFSNCNGNPADGCEIFLCEGGTCDNPQLQPGSVQFDYTGELEFFTIPACVETLTIEALGASGGSGLNVGYPGGFGARMQGDFQVDGNELTLLVGGVGLDALDLGQQGGGSGGGGSFVVDAGGTPMLVAGGGGGANYVTEGGQLLAPGGDGGTEQAGQPGGSPDGGVGGNNGTGGGSLDWPGWHGGTGGGGLLGDGLGPSSGSDDFGTPNLPGQSFLTGGAGGIGGSDGGRDGGFGGGGSAGFCGGGGGGYSGGGAAGTAIDLVGGGGGGSINLGDNQDNQAGNNLGDGVITLSW